VRTWEEEEEILHHCGRRDYIYNDDEWDGCVDDTDDGDEAAAGQISGSERGARRVHKR
jgi:hypothetical protein